MNLLYGAVYRVSPSERLFSSESAPGLVLALGELSVALASSDVISIYYVPFPLHNAMNSILFFRRGKHQS